MQIEKIFGIHFLLYSGEYMNPVDSLFGIRLWSKKNLRHGKQVLTTFYVKKLYFCLCNSNNCSTEWYYSHVFKKILVKYHDYCQ